MNNLINLPSLAEMRAEWHELSYRYSSYDEDWQDFYNWLTTFKPDELKVCTGCGHRSDVPLHETALACCPDSSYIPLNEYLDNSVYKRIVKQDEPCPQHGAFTQMEDGRLICGTCENELKEWLEKQINRSRNEVDPCRNNSYHSVLTFLNSKSTPTDGGSKV